MTRPARLSIEMLRAAARARGGRCLSSHYTNNKQKLDWQCRHGHRWRARAMNIRTGYWCPECGGSRAKTLDELKVVAALRGGTCLSRKPVAGDKYARWRCAAGHTWHARPMNIRAGYWCPRCASTAPLGLAVMRDEARKHGGRCLSRHYRNSRERLLWQCAEGHRWHAMGEKIRAGQWCPTCARKRLRHRL